MEPAPSFLHTTIILYQDYFDLYTLLFENWQ